MMKSIARIFAAVIVVVAIIVALNWSNIQRLMGTISLFDEDKIVRNFSNMDSIFLTRSFKAPDTQHIWGERPQPLPQTVTIGAQPRDLDAFLQDTATTSLLVIKGNDILHESYHLGTQASDRRITWSVSKSVVSALIGIALERGEIKSLDDKVTDYVPALSQSAYAEATILNLLHMASGVAFSEEYDDFNSDINRMGRVIGFGGSMDDFAASLITQDRAPGTGKHYVSVDTHVLGMVLRAATGQSMHDLFNERLWSQIGPASDGFFLEDGEGTAFVLGGLNLTTRDYARFGALYRDGGRSMGAQVVPQDWVYQSTVKSAPQDVEDFPQDYGMHFWVPRPLMEDIEGNEFYAHGIYSQMIYVNRAADIVIVKTSADVDFEGVGPSGRLYQNETVEMIQALVRHYGDLP